VDESVWTAAERLQTAAAASAIPKLALLAHSNADTLPSPGQLWRVRWEDTVELVIVLAATDTTVSAAPVTEDVDYADDESVVLPAAACPLEVDMVAWLGLARNLPNRVLDRTFGAASQTWCDVALGGRGTTAEHGDELVLDSDLRHQYRAQLKDNLVRLAEARWVPEGAGGLDAILSTNALGPRELVAILQVEVPAAVSLVRGQMPVTAEQADLLADHVRLPPEDILAANPAPPGPVCALVDLPRHRPQIDRLAAQRGITDTEAHRVAAYGSWAVAARQTGVLNDSVWEHRLQQYFTVALYE